MQAVTLILIAFAGQTADQRATNHDRDDNLRGLPSFKVVVEEMHPASPVTIAQLQTDTELRLRSLGIELSKDSFSTLYINVNVLPVKMGEKTMYFAIAHGVSFATPATILSTGMVTLVVVWNDGSVGAAGAEATQSPAQYIREGVKDQVDKFANAWLKMHPKENAAPKKPITPKP